MKMTLAATKPNEQIYFVIDPKEPHSDGVVVSNGTVRYVPFWSYVTREDISPVRSNQFLQELWSNGTTDDWTRVYFLREEKIPEDRIESVGPYLIDVPDETESGVATDDLRPIRTTEEKADSPVRPGGIVRRLRSGKQRTDLAMEPYDPDARDGDNDGIVQEGTAWERPAGTRILDVLGREIRRGRQAGKRPLGVRVVDRDGNDVDYKPTYEGGKPGTIGSTVQRTTPTVKPVEEPAVPAPAKKAAAKKAPKPKRESPLADHGARSLRERGLPSAREQYRAATTPPEPEAPETPVTPEVPIVTEKPKSKKPKETPVFGDIALFPGVTSDSADRPELVKPERPRSPFKPSPPPLSGRAQELADEAEGDFETFMELLDKEGYVVFDYETTGLQDGNIPVQIGAVRIKDGKIVERFNVFTNPQRPLSDWSKENLKDGDGNPLTDEWLAEQTDLAEAHRQLAEFMGDSIIVAHNLPYDGEIIDRMMKDAEIDFKPSGSIDTLMLLRSAVPKGDGETGPERHTLGSLADFFGVDLGDAAHTADADSEAAGQVLQRAMKWAKDNDSDPEIFDAEKQKELFDTATKKYNADRKKYEEALKQYQADLADYERAVTRADEPVVETDSPEYRMMHQPSDVGPRAHDLTEDGGEGEWLSDDVYANPDRYTGADKTVVRETMEQLRQARGNPDAKVTIYRWAPEGSSIQDGNWVSLSRTYAEQHGESNAGDVAGSVISLEVPAREVRFAGDDLAEFGWFPEKSDRISKNSGDSPEAPVVDPESVWDIYFPGEAYDRDWLEGQTMKDNRRDIRNRLSYFVSRLSDDDRQKLQDEFGTDDLDEIAERLQERVDENIAFAVNDLRKKELHMAVPPEALMAILRERRIRSMFETGSSLGTNDRAVRREVESRLIGVPWETPDELRPIYGFVSGDDEPFALTQGEAARHYGGLVITFKNSKKLRERTTMTAGDSLDYDLHAVPVEGRVSPERLFAASYYNGSTIVQEALWGVERDVTEEVLGRDYDYPDFGEGGSLNYNEIQIHGGATLDDIEEVVYPPDLDDETREEIIAALDAAGVKHREDW